MGEAQLSRGSTNAATIQLFDILKNAGVPVERSRTQNAVYVDNGESKTLINVMTYQQPNTPSKSNPLSLS